MIKKLYIKNFRNINELTLEPSSYINLISGNNGEGKSSILYAIEYLLTDNLNEKISEYVRWGQDKFNLEMEFDFNGNNYIIKVEGSKSSKKELIVNNTDIYKNSEATKYLATIIDPNVTRYSAISEQGKTAQILFDTPANRLKKLKEILGIDKIFELVEDIKEEIKQINSDIDLNKKEIEVIDNIDYNLLDVPVLPDIKDIKTKFSDDTIGVIFPILSRNRFSTCLRGIAKGAKKIFAIDVGYGQLAWSLRTDPRVINMERTNVRTVTFADIGEAADFISIDVSFISLKLILPVLKTIINKVKKRGNAYMHPSL